MAGKSPLNPENIPGSNKINKPDNFEQKPSIKPNKEAFQSYMKETPTDDTVNTGQVSPMDLAKSTTPQAAGVSMDSLLGQADTTSNTINSLQNNLNTPNLKFKHSQQRLLDNKLTDAQSHITTASEKLGAPLLPKTKIPAGSRPVVKFLSYVTDGQNQILAAKKQLQAIKAKGQALKPTDMLLVQVKLAQAQQELEYSSVLVSKVVDVIKQTINIQI
jgi:hypothetical protein